jgi:hypothetical protein
MSALRVAYPTRHTHSIFNSNPCQGNKATTEASHIYEATLTAQAGHQATRIPMNHQRVPTLLFFLSYLPKRVILYTEAATKIPKRKQNTI